MEIKTVEDLRNAYPDLCEQLIKKAKFPASITEPYVLVVEGVEEKFFFEALIDHIGLKQVIVLPIGGKTQLRRHLKTLFITSGHENILSLAVVRDADLNAASAFQSVCDALEAVF